jgi:hypothetical protein
MKKGFTLIELIFFMLIISFVLFFLILMMINLSNLNLYLTYGLGVLGETDLFLSEIKKELKSIEISNVGAYPLEEITSTTITFYSDLDGDGLIERVRYFLDGDNLFKGIIKPTGNPLRYDQNEEKIKKVLKNLVLPQKIFVGYDINLNETYDIAKIRLIEVKVKVRTDNKGNFYENSIIINPRNLRTK